MVLNGREINNGIIRTNDNCIGCNKCIHDCPIFCANIAVETDSGNKIFVDPDRCIACGKCMDECEHGARVFVDDTQRFLEDLKAKKQRGEPSGISLLIAPSFVINYPEKYPMILGYLKHLGVEHIYSVSVGADITTWAYIKHIQGTEGQGVISQPCPVIVSAIEKHYPELLERLIPLHSPLLCTAIYLRKYRGFEGDLAFLSPCIAKKSEIQRPSNAGQVQYNITFAHLVEALAHVDLTAYHAEDTEIDYGMGALFPVHGGLKQNIEFYLGDELFVNQKEGEVYAYSYLELYSNNINIDDPCRADVVDILNCARGCLYGTATEFKHTASNHIPYYANKMRKRKQRMMAGGQSMETLAPAERLALLNAHFAELDMEDFRAEYTNRDTKLPAIKKEETIRIYRDMLKYNDAERSVDCGSCGFWSCREMATAIALGFNYRDNCVQYVKKKLLIEHSESVIRKQQIERLQSSMGDSASMDRLTGLPNRYRYEQQIEKSMKNAMKTGRTSYLFSIDMDDFKTINESYGYNYGNSLLIEFSKFLKETFQDVAEIFRVGGDEFMMLLEGADDMTSQSATDAIMARVQSAWKIMDVRLYCTVSMGVARFPDMDDSVNDVTKNVDIAKYQAKQQGKNNCVMYDREKATGLHAHVDTIRAMRDAVSAGMKGFEVHFQPWVTEERIIGAEALLRWRGETGRFVSPGEFIPVAETTGLIIPIGEFVLREAALFCKEMNRISPHFMTSVNVSVKQFNKPEIVTDFLGILRETGVDMRNIVLEITESLGIESLPYQKVVLGQFAKQGIRVGLDDFGTGYSSLSYMNELPLNLVKIDRSFIQDIETDIYSQYMLSTMADLMHKMGRMVCVEGVETDAQLEYCRRCQVDIIQGYYYYKPMPAAEFSAVFERVVFASEE